MSLKPALLLVVDDCHLYSSVPEWPLAAAALVKAEGSKGVVPLCAAAIVPPELGLTHIVTSSTLLSAASVQLAQVDRASRLNQVVCVSAPALYVSVVAPTMSLKPALPLVVDDCHLYSRVPVCPLAATLLVKAAGSKGELPLCAAAMVPPVVGLVQTALRNTEMVFDE